MYLLVGLGNPGLQYAATRHNIGFEVVERFAYENNIKLNQNKHKAIIGTGIVKGKKVMLAQPQTYMNRSGESIRALMEFYKIELENLLVIYDDTSLDLGRIRIRKKGSAGGHNGIKNTILHLGTQEFPRVKVGVGEKPPGWNLADYVLARFNKDEMDSVIDLIKKSSDAVESFIDQGIEFVMNNYNS